MEYGASDNFPPDNRASLSVLGSHGVSVQFHAGLNALKRGITIALLYYVRRDSHRGDNTGRIGAITTGAAEEGVGGGGGFFGTDTALLALALAGLPRGP